MANVINQIKLGNIEYAIAASAYAECGTLADDEAKIATICTGGDLENNAFTLIKGVAVQVKFAYTNSANNPTLNVSGSGAKDIHYKGAAINADYLKANYTYTFVYNGNQWDLVGEIDTDATVTLSEDIWTDKTIGYVNGTSSTPVKVANAGDTLKTMFTKIFGTVTDDFSNLVINPSISSVSIGSSSYEYGTKLKSLSVTISPSSGSYKYGPDVIWPENKVWNGNYTLSGEGFTSKESDTDSTTVSLTSEFIVGTSSALTLTASRAYNAATNTAESKMGAPTNQQIVAGTATKSGTFNPTAAYYQYWGFTSGSGTTPNLENGNTRLDYSGESVTYTPSESGRLWFFDTAANKTIKQYIDGDWIVINTGKVADPVDLTLKSKETAKYYAYYTDILAADKAGEIALK